MLGREVNVAVAIEGHYFEVDCLDCVGVDQKHVEAFVFEGIDDDVVAESERKRFHDVLSLDIERKSHEVFLGGNSH